MLPLLLPLPLPDELPLEPLEELPEDCGDLEVDMPEPDEEGRTSLIPLAIVEVVLQLDVEGVE